MIPRDSNPLSHHSSEWWNNVF